MRLITEKPSEKEIYIYGLYWGVWLMPDYQ